MKASFLTRDILGMPVAVLDKLSAVLLIKDYLTSKKPLRLAFLNANLANMAMVDKHLHDCLQKFLLLNDGSGVSLASRILYQDGFPDNLNGTDFITFFLDRYEIPLRVYLLGASPKVSKLVVDIFQERWPLHQLVGAHHGYFSDNESNSIFAEIEASKADLIFVAMGNGLQEKLVTKLVPELAVSAWGVGAFFDFLCNEVPRAPKWMRVSGIEWVFRLCQEPKRLWRRYLIGNFKFIYHVICQFISRS